MRARSISVAITLCLAVAGCAMPPSIPPELETRPAYLTDAEKAAVQVSVRNVLKDPDAAKFGPIGAARFVRNDNSLLVCGWVNGRNSFGGYTGMQPFMGVLESPQGAAPTFKTQLIGSKDSERLAAIQLCGQQGVPLVGAGGYSL